MMARNSIFGANFVHELVSVDATQDLRTTVNGHTAPTEIHISRDRHNAHSTDRNICSTADCAIHSDASLPESRAQGKRPLCPESRLELIRV